METVQLTRRTDGKVRATDEQKRAILDLINGGKPIAEVVCCPGSCDRFELKI